MQLGIIGLGKMGGNMARRLRRANIEVVGFDRDPSVAEALAEECGVMAAAEPRDLVEALDSPRVVWLMLPAGDVTEASVEQMKGLLAPGDILVDGANSWFKDSMRRGASLAERGIEFVDAGVSGGVWGLENGYALMVGGSPEAVERLQPVVTALAPAPDRGWLHTGPAGSGHFVKMVHNGIEYGMMQAFAEGFALMKNKPGYDLQLGEIAELWRHGSVVRSWLLDLSAEFLAADSKLEAIQPFVADSGEGRWTALEAVEQGIPAPVMSLALMMRFASQGKSDYAAKVLAKMRQGFGGHTLKEEGK